MKLRILIFLSCCFFTFLVYSQDAAKKEASLQPAVFTSHLPLILIDTYGQTIVSEPKKTVGIKVIDNGTGRSNSTTDPGNQYNGQAGIEIHGQSSQMFPKKSYSFELRNSGGDELQVGLMGMPEESDWIMYAPYSDKTMLRNAVTYSLGGRLGRYQPRFRFCEVFMNNSYIGVYQLTEKIKRDNDRVNITKMTANDVTGDNLTGGFILKVDKSGDLPSSEYFINYPDIRFGNARNITWTWYYPKVEDLNYYQSSWFKSYIKTVENTINGPYFSNPDMGYPKYLDVNSFIDFQIMNELGNNVDGYRYSTFFYKDRDSKGGKLVAGPLWDFDLCYGNLNYSDKNLRVDQWEFNNYGTAEWNCMHWWARLMQDPEYVKAVKQRFSILRKRFLNTDSVMNYIDTQVTWLGDAVARNFTQWPILGTYVWPNSDTRYTYSAEIAFFKDWITRRLTWMDSQWLVPVTENPDITPSPLTVFPNPFGKILHINLPSGDTACFIEIFDIHGVSVFSYQHLHGASGNLAIDLQGLKNGIYMMKVVSKNKGVQVKKILKSDNQ
jgi:hypothetical protein